MTRPAHRFSGAVPAPVLEAINGGMNPSAAWRNHLGITAATLATTLGVSLERLEMLEMASATAIGPRTTLAPALGIQPGQMGLWNVGYPHTWRP